MKRSCEKCIRGPMASRELSACRTCGDDLTNYIAAPVEQDEERRIDIIGANGNDGLHYVLTDDPVNHPVHYTSHPSGIECIQITEHMGFCLGNAMKYLWRADEKGKDIEDLRKAAWYIEREIARRVVESARNA